jgi:hypothetical protein
MASADKLPCSHLHVSEMATGKELHVIEVDRKRFTGMAFAFAPDSKTLTIASGKNPPSIGLWEVETACEQSGPNPSVCADP